jgi:hypothetical protein
MPEEKTRAARARHAGCRSADGLRNKDISQPED